MRIQPDKRTDSGGFDMTSMIDVVFLLIIFFMCVTEIADRSRAAMALPRADCAEPDRVSSPGRLVLNVDAEGVLTVLGVSYATEDIPLLASFDQGAVLVRADARTAYRHVQGVLYALQRVGRFKVAFATRDPDAR